MMPWEMLKNADRYIGWLVGYAGSLGAIAGVLIVDYWLLRKRTLDLASLYLTEGTYTYRSGYNGKAIAATLIGAVFAFAGAFWDPLRPIYNWSWFVGFGLAGGLYWVMMRGTIPPPPQGGGTSAR
jgi:NCS1 family nucleobase:cation symporter-1